MQMGDDKLTTDGGTDREMMARMTTDRNLLRSRSDSGTENVHYPLMYEGLPEEAKLYAEQVLNETEENKAEGIRNLKEFMKRENLTCPDDSLLVIVLRNCKYDISASESKLKRFLRTRQLIINKVSQMDMETIKNIFDDSSSTYLPWRREKRECIVYTTCGSIDKYEADDLVILGLAKMLFMLQFPMSSIYGVAYIVNGRVPRYNHYFAFNILRKLVPLLYDMPYRLVRSDIINETFISRLVFNLLRPFLPEKMKKRLMFHGSDLSNLHQFYHPDILPEEIGGNLGPMDGKYGRIELLKFIERLREENIDITDLGSKITVDLHSNIINN